MQVQEIANKKASSKKKLKATLGKLNSGMHKDLPAKDYFAHPAANASLLKSLKYNSPAKAKALSEIPHKPTADMLTGTCVHTLVLEESEFNTRYLVKDLNLRTNADKEIKAQAESIGISIISEEQYDQAKAMRDSIMSHAEAKHLFTGGESEVTLLWNDKDSGASCKSRNDYLNLKLGAIVDLKTCTDLTDDGIQKSISKYSYHIQEAHYKMGARAVLGLELDFIFVFVEKTPPYEVRVGRLPLDVSCFAEASIKPILKLYQECITSGVWPGREQKIEEFSLSPWKMKELQKE